MSSRRITLATAACLCLLGDATAASIAGTPTFSCKGQEATIVGTTGRDEIRGTPGRDVIVVRAGRDSVDGLGGDDFICLGRGGENHWIPEEAQGGAGNDLIVGGEGRDQIEGGEGNDRLIGDLPSERLDTYFNRDSLGGGRGRDVLIGGQQGDGLNGGPGADNLSGGRQRDQFFPGLGDDEMHGGDETDEVYFYTKAGRKRLLVDLVRGIARGEGADTLESVEWVITKPSSRIVGDRSNNMIFTGYRDDTVEAGGGRDRLIDIGGHNFLDGGPGNDRFDPGANMDPSTLRGGSGEDLLDLKFTECAIFPDLTVRLDKNFYRCDGRTHSITLVENVRATRRDEVLVGDEAANEIRGAAGNDQIRGGPGDDTLLGVRGDDSVKGSAGDDFLDGGHQADDLDGGTGADECVNGETTNGCEN